ncbi:MAG: transglutaminase family protein [Acidimicrobiales bacterium]|nr:transglutaminase family protein [Acidimicrobiales bacterium]
MLLSVSHTTRYRYEEPVPYGLMQIRLTPTSGPLQEVVEWDHDIVGASIHAAFNDQHRNRVHLLGTNEGTTEVSITVRGQVETFDSGGVIPHLDGHAPLWLYTRATPFTTMGHALQTLRDASPLNQNPNPGVMELHELSALVLSEVAYEPGRTVSQTTAEEAVQSGHGVCQDHAHVFATLVRSAGMPVRYVSGYLSLDEGQEDASHAWAEAWVEHLGWVGFDVSNGISPDDRYVRIAAGLDYHDVAPITGIRTGAGEESLEVHVTVEDQPQQ